MIWVRWCLLKSIMKKKFKNGISLITIPVPIVCVFQGCVISSCWYFAQALLRILITACFRSLFLCAMIRWRLPTTCFLFQQPSGPGKKFESNPFLGGLGVGGNHLIFRRTEGGITRNWEPKKEIIEEELRNWIQRDDSNLLDNTSLRAYKINASILLGGESACSLNLF